MEGSGIMIPFFSDLSGGFPSPQVLVAEECLDIDDVFKPSWAVFLIVPCVDQYPREIVKILGLSQWIWMGLKFCIKIFFFNLFERQREKWIEISCPLVHSPVSVATRAGPGQSQETQVSHMVADTQALLPLLPPRVHIIKRLELGTEPGLAPRHRTGGGHPEQFLNCCTKCLPWVVPL